jgi:hypothetical protein
LEIKSENCGNPHKVKKNEVARINIVQAQVEEIVFIFNLEYVLSFYQKGYHIDYQQSLNAQHSLRTPSEMNETQCPHTFTSL